MIWCDTRQQKGKHRHVDGWFEARGVPFEYRKLDFGDYARADGASNVAVDTKKDVAEVAGNVGRDHARFARECDRAREAGWRLVVLVEEHPEYNDRAALSTWVSGACRRCRRCDPRSDACRRYRFKPMQGGPLAKIVAGLERNHGVRFEFCSRRDTARRICELLGVEYGQGAAAARKGGA